MTPRIVPHTRPARARALVLPRLFAAALLVLGLLVTALIAPVTTVLIQPAAAEGLDQTVAPEEPVQSEKATIRKGHVDIGARFLDEDWTMLVRDDSAVPPVWRNPSDVVMQVPDGAGQLPVPDDPAYEFLGQSPGTQVYVIPQTQNPDVVWVGWNTQDPEVVKRLDRGATLRMLGVDGPGNLIVFLQDGGFSPPQVLWDDRQELPQDIWVDTNTHTHANWVFTEPGVYLVKMEIQGKLKNGNQASATGVLRFAVGSSADVEEAATRAFPDAASPAAQPAEQGQPAADKAGWVWIAAFAAGGLAVVAIVAVLVRSAVRSARARRQVERERGQ